MDIVKNGKEKQEAYRKNFGTLSKAMRNKFYLEAVVISYAIMEDRLVSFLHHAGIVTRDKGNLKVNTRPYPYMRELLGIKKTDAIRVKDISVKLGLILSLLNMTEERAKEIDSAVDQKTAEKALSIKPLNNYMEMLFRQTEETVDREKAKEILKNIDRWRESRNQLIHALLSKTVETSEAAKQVCAEEGQVLARELDNVLVKKFKKQNDLRKKYKIQ